MKVTLNSFKRIAFFSCLLLFYFLRCNSITCQNLIPNPDFELIEPDSFNLPNIVKEPGWCLDANELENWFAPTYLSLDICSYPDIAYSGNQFLRIVTCYKGSQKKQYRGYLMVKLTQPLQKDSTYIFRYFIKKGENFQYASNGIGILLLENRFESINEINLFHYPNAVVSKDIIIDETAWSECILLYKANGNEQYLIIGNFLPKKKSKIRRVKRTGYRCASYFIDNVSLELFRPLS